jgi:hypothetical protein
VYIVYKSISGSWALVPAAWLMLFVGVAKYAEKTLALHRANLANVQSSVERQQQRHRTEGGSGSHRPPKLAFPLDDDGNDLVMKAHTLFHICKNSMVDSSVVAESDIDNAAAAQTKKTLFDLEWKELFTVMEIELSLMYDFLYTKAAIIHTWHGYCIRVLSPLATTVSLVLVELSNEGGRRHKRSDIVITRFLLVATFLLESASLLRALSSTWTGFLLHSKLRPGWIRHEVLCMRRWHRFHSVITSLGRPTKAHAHRQWLGKMGQLNMLELVITQKEPAPKGGQFWDKEYQRCSKNTMIIRKEVKKLVLEHVSIRLNRLRVLMKKAVVQAGVEVVPEDMDLLKVAEFLRTERGQDTIEKNDKLSDLRWSLGDEPQLDILTWHIATNMFLLLSGKAAEAKDEGTGDEGLKVEAIMTLSNYMMYLLVVSPYMLPGLVTRKIIKLSCEDLARIWSEHWPPPAAADHLESSSSSPSFCNVRFFMPSKFFSQYGQWRVPTRLSQGREDLAKMLMDWHKSRDNAVTLNTYLHGGVRLAMNMLHVEKRHNKEELDIVQVILDVWVSMLFYASYQCSKESHAKQLSQGGELTTIVWLMAEHFGLFIVNKTSKGTEDNGRTGKEAKASDS